MDYQREKKLWSGSFDESIKRLMSRMKRKEKKKEGGLMCCYQEAGPGLMFLESDQRHLTIDQGPSCKKLGKGGEIRGARNWAFTKPCFLRVNGV